MQQIVNTLNRLISDYISSSNVKITSNAGPTAMLIDSIAFVPGKNKRKGIVMQYSSIQLINKYLFLSERKAKSQ